MFDEPFVVDALPAGAQAEFQVFGQLREMSADAEASGADRLDDVDAGLLGTRRNPCTAVVRSSAAATDEKQIGTRNQFPGPLHQVGDLSQPGAIAQVRDRTSELEHPVLSLQAELHHDASCAWPPHTPPDAAPAGAVSPPNHSVFGGMERLFTGRELFAGSSTRMEDRIGTERASLGQKAGLARPLLRLRNTRNQWRSVEMAVGPRRASPRPGCM